MRVATTVNLREHKSWGTAVPDDQHRRLRALAEGRGNTWNWLIDDTATVKLAELYAEVRLRLRAACRAGQEARGLAQMDQAQGET